MPIKLGAVRVCGTKIKVLKVLYNIVNIILTLAWREINLDPASKKIHSYEKELNTVFSHFSQESKGENHDVRYF